MLKGLTLEDRRLFSLSTPFLRTGEVGGDFEVRPRSNGGG